MTSPVAGADTRERILAAAVRRIASGSPEPAISTR